MHLDFVAEKFVIIYKLRFEAQEYKILDFHPGFGHISAAKKACEIA
jgi:hypothetical protein